MRPGTGSSLAARRRGDRFLGPVLVGIPAAALLVAAWDPAQHGGPPLCPFRGLTGVACPGCGLTRAAGALLRGRVGDALSLHPLILLFVAQVTVLWALALLVRRRRRGSLLPRSTPRWLAPAVVGANATVFFGVWLVRLATDTLASSA